MSTAYRIIRIAMTALIRAMRPLHWSKNILLFAPLLLAHRATDPQVLQAAGAAFLAFCLAASATYIANDIADVRNDRAHPRKKDRVLASGALSVPVAATAAVFLLAAALVIATLISYEAVAFVAGYAVLSLVYSTLLKKRVFLDALALSALWTLRVLAGGVVTEVVVSDWLLAFSGFMFVGLALMKRYADLALFGTEAAAAAPGRGYVAADRDLLRSMGVTSGYLAVLVMALYVTSPDVARLYESPRLLWLVCPLLLYWVAHMWFLAHRGAIQDDPIVVAVRDPASYGVGLLIALVVYAAI